MALNFIKNGFDILRGYASILGSDGNLEDPNQLADKEFFTNNQIKQEINQDTTNPKKNISNQPKKYDNEIQMLKELGYIGKDKKGVYVQIKSDKQTQKDFSNVEINKIMNTWNRWYRLNNITTTLESIANPATAQSEENQDFKKGYFKRNEINPQLSEKYTKKSFEKYDWADLSEKEKQQLNNPTKLFIKNYLDQDKLGTKINADEDNQEPGTKYYLNGIQPYQKIAEMIIGYKNNGDIDSLKNEIENWAEKYQEKKAEFDELSKELKKLRENENGLENGSSNLNNTINQGIFRFGAGAGLTTKGTPTLYVSGELENVLIGLSVTDETSTTEKLPTKQPKPIQISPGRTAHQKEESRLEKFKSKAYDLMFGYRLRKNVSPFLTVGHKEKATNKIATSEKWQEIDGEIYNPQKDPETLVEQNKVSMMRFGGGVLVNPTNYLAVKLAANFSNFDTPEYSASIGLNIGDLEKNVKELNYEDILYAIENATSTVQPSIGAVHTEEGTGLTAGLNIHGVDAKAIYVPKNKGKEFLGGTLGYQVADKLTTSLLGGQSTINNQKKLQLGAEIEAKMNEYSSVLAGIKGDKKEQKAYVGTKVNLSKILK